MRIRSAFGLAAVAGMAVSSTAVAQFNTVTNIPGTFTDISATGITIATGDDAAGAFTSSVTNAVFPVASVFGATNGYISNANSSTFTNAALPFASVGNGLFPYWDDLYVD